MKATVLAFRPHPSQKRFLEESERGHMVAFQGQPRPRVSLAMTMSFGASTPSQTALSTPEAAEPKRYVPPANDMSFLHQMNSLECLVCGHDWMQPAKTGRCPKCRSDRTQVFLSRTSKLKRV